MENKTFGNARKELDQMRVELGELMDQSLSLTRHITLGIMDMQDFVHTALKELRGAEQFVETGSATPVDATPRCSHCG